MRYLFGFVCVLALGVMGCSETAGTGGSAGDGGTGGGGVGGDGGTGGVETTELTAIITGFDPAQGGALGPLEGVEICFVETEVCVLTDDTGIAVAEAPVNQELSVTLEKEGFARYLIPFVVPEQAPPFGLGMASLERYEFLHGLVMSPYPPEDTGSVVIIVEPEVAGRTFDLGSAAGKVFYYDEEGNWDADLTETTSWGWGGFTEVSPGEVQVQLGGIAEGCVGLAGWPGDVENSFRMPIRAGYNSEISVLCNSSNMQ